MGHTRFLSPIDKPATAARSSDRTRTPFWRYQDLRRCGREAEGGNPEEQPCAPRGFSQTVRDKNAMGSE